MRDKPSYKKNYLTNVIARIDFISPLKDLNGELPSEISRAALIDFPIAEPQKMRTTQFEFEVSARNLKQSDKEYTEWTFHGRDRKKRLVISPSVIFVEYTRYVTYEETKDQFMRVLQVLFDIYKDAVCSRIGLRYINNITLESGGDPLDWKELLNEKLLSALTFYPELKKYLARSFHSLELNFGEYNLGYQFGIINPDYPAVIKQKNFILDMDAHYRGSIDYRDIGDNLDRFHDRIQAIFEESITNKMREKLNE